MECCTVRTVENVFLIKKRTPNTLTPQTKHDYVYVGCRSLLKEGYLVMKLVVNYL